MKDHQPNQHGEIEVPEHTPFETFLLDHLTSDETSAVRERDVYALLKAYYGAQGWSIPSWPKFHKLLAEVPHKKVDHESVRLLIGARWTVEGHFPTYTNPWYRRGRGA